MKEYLCIKDIYIGDVKLASIGDHVVTFDDGKTIINNSNGVNMKEARLFINDPEYFVFTYETGSNKIPNYQEIAKRVEDKVNHPSHYTWLKAKCGIEVIDITRHMDFDLGNAVKYILRAGHKEEEGMTNKEKTIQDLEKAIWYLKDKIKELKN